MEAIKNKTEDFYDDPPIFESRCTLILKKKDILCRSPYITYVKKCMGKRNHKHLQLVDCVSLSIGLSEDKYKHLILTSFIVNLNCVRYLLQCRINMFVACLIDDHFVQLIFVISN